MPPFFTDVTGERMLDLAREHRLEWVVAKRVDSPYQPSRRPPTWIKHPLRSNTEGVIVGWVDGSGAATGGIGALLLGAYDDPIEGHDRALRYIGRLGTGYTSAVRRELRTKLQKTEQHASPLDVGPPARDARGIHGRPRDTCATSSAANTPAAACGIPRSKDYGPTRHPPRSTYRAGIEDDRNA
ncbi:hypothetical protein [Rhodococcus sp. DMU1]|uniref:ATP dependent DNA ligase n=1 Tax=Rhodococcus sp. DMU1 TaxID=2722825 RepID=UPI0032B850FF